MGGDRPGLQPISDCKLAYSLLQRKELLLLFYCSSHKNDSNTFSSSIAVILKLAWLFKYRSSESWTNWILKDGRQEGTQPVVPYCRLAIDGNLYHDFFLFAEDMTVFGEAAIVVMLTAFFRIHVQVDYLTTWCTSKIPSLPSRAQ
jgi:hypothetical protein